MSPVQTKSPTRSAKGSMRLEIQQVYLLSRPIFAVQTSIIRKQKTIRALVSRHQQALRPVLEDLGEDRVVSILRSLIARNIFDSEIAAKTEFPELFPSSPNREILCAASEVDAARNLAETIRNIEFHRESGGEERVGITPQMNSNQNAAHCASNSRRSSAGWIEKPNAPSHQPLTLYPSYLPYQAQHLTLTTVQTVLEECCYNFAKKWIPSELEIRGWDCPAAVELTKWARILRANYHKLPTHALTFNGATVDALIADTHDLRHTAVHRLQITARGVMDLINPAIKLTEALEDSVRAEQLKQLQNEIHGIIKAMDFNKNVLEDELAQKLQEITSQRNELDKLEKEFILATLKEDSENKYLVGVLLEDSLRNIFENRPSCYEITEEEDDEMGDGVDEEEPENGEGALLPIEGSDLDLKECR